MTGPLCRPHVSARSGRSKLKMHVALLMRPGRRLRLIGCGMRLLSELRSGFGSSPQVMS